MAIQTHAPPFFIFKHSREEFMKKTLNTTAVVLSVLLASTAFAGGGKKMGPGCPEA